MISLHVNITYEYILMRQGLCCRSKKAIVSFTSSSLITCLANIAPHSTIYSLILIMCVTALLLYHLCNSVRQTIVEFLNKLLRNLMPLLLHCRPQFIKGAHGNTLSMNPTLEVIPYMLNDVQVGALSWPRESFDVVVLQPLLCLL